MNPSQFDASPTAAEGLPGLGEDLILAICEWLLAVSATPADDLIALTGTSKKMRAFGEDDHAQSIWTKALRAQQLVQPLPFDAALDADLGRNTPRELVLTRQRLSRDPHSTLAVWIGTEFRVNPGMR